jgi:hypothetical protein
MSIVTINNRSINRSDTASADQVWTATSATASDFQAAVGGKVLQCITATDVTVRSTTSTSFVTGSNTLSVDITPSATSSKILVFVSTTVSTTGGTPGEYTIYRDSTNLSTATSSTGFLAVTQENIVSNLGLHVLDSPSSTSELTYQPYMSVGGSGTVYMGSDSYNDAMSTITCMEIGA